MHPVMDAVWALIRAGVLRPTQYGDDALVTLALTDSGVRFLDNYEEHPLALSFIERLRARSPGIRESVVVLLEDVRACLDAHLLRPAVANFPPAYPSSFRRRKISNDCIEGSLSSVSGTRTLIASATK